MNKPAKESQINNHRFDDFAAKSESLNSNQTDPIADKFPEGFSLEITDANGEIFDLFADESFRIEDHQISQIAELESLLDLLGDPALVFDPSDDSILAANGKFSEIYQRKHGELVNESFKFFWQIPGQRLEFIDAVLERKKLTGFDALHLYPEGTIRVSLNALLIMHRGKPAIVLAIKNILEEKQVGQSIIRAIQEWSDTVDAISDLIILEDADGNLRRCNRATTEFFKLHYLELIGQPVSSLLRKENSVYFLDIHEETEADSLEHLRDPQWEGQLKGRENWFEITNHALPSISSDRTSWVHIVTDITERRAAEAERQKLYTAIEQAADAIIITDLEGLIQYVNSSFERISGWNRNEVFGRDISNIKIELDEDLNTDEIFSVILSGQVWQQTYKTTRKNGEVFDEQTTISLVRDAQGNPINYVFSCRDVSEARRLESIAEAINMMDNVGYIFSGIRHELGNPINSIKTALTVLKQNLKKWSTDQVDVYIERCLTETTRVEYLLQTMKTFSMHENPECSRFLNRIYE